MIYHSFKIAFEKEMHDIMVVAKRLLDKLEEQFRPDIHDIFIGGQRDNLAETRGYFTVLPQFEYGNYTILQPEEIDNFIRSKLKEETQVKFEITWEKDISFNTYNAGIARLRDECAPPLDVMHINCLISDETKDELIHIANYFSKNLAEEVERIYRTKPNSFEGYPVIYILSGFPNSVEHTIIDILMTALYRNNRLLSKHLYRTHGPIANFMDEDSVENLIIKGRHFRSGLPDTDTYQVEDRSTDGNYSFYDLKAAAQRKQIFVSSAFMTEYWASLRYRYKFNMVNIIPLNVKSIPKYINMCLKDYNLENETALINDIHKFIINDSMNHPAIRNSGPYLFKMVDRYMYDEYLFKQRFNEYYKLQSQVYGDIKYSSENETKLDALIGVSDVKQKIHSIVNAFAYFSKEADETDGNTNDGIKFQNRNMIFTGSPGTCKTTVARLLASILGDNNISSGVFVEVGRADLVGQYVGWTAAQVKEKYEDAVGGVLFIDEAYSLSQDAGGYGREAINTIVQCMENYRQSVITIFAGYPKEMKAFLESNPGIKSRIGFYVDFPDYSLDELTEIFKVMVKDRDMTATPKAIEEFRKLVEPKLGGKDFGNGRFVRNVLDQVVIKHANRMIDISRDISTIPAKKRRTITKEDLIGLDLKEIKVKESKPGF